MDLVAPEGTGVRSPGPGVVTFAGQVARRGVVVVTHPDGLRTSLEPVAASVPVGTAVAAGSAIGAVEAAGPTTRHDAEPLRARSCVHWGVRRGERYLDPLSLLDRRPIVLLPTDPLSAGYLSSRTVSQDKYPALNGWGTVRRAGTPGRRRCAARSASTWV